MAMRSGSSIVSPGARPKRECNQRILIPPFGGSIPPAPASGQMDATSVTRLPIRSFCIVLTASRTVFKTIKPIAPSLHDLNLFLKEFIERI
jgi:hypothetical protein